MTKSGTDQDFLQSLCFQLHTGDEYTASDDGCHMNGLHSRNRVLISCHTQPVSIAERRMIW